MGLYTVVHIHPIQPDYQPDERTVRAVLDLLQIKRVEVVSGNPKIPWWRNLKDCLFPRLIVRHSVDDLVFYEKDVNVDQAIDLWLNGGAYSVHYLLGGKGILKNLSEAIRDSIPVEISKGFVPWDSGISIGPWAAHDYECGKKTAFGRFAITKSADEYPSNLQRYGQAFEEVPEVKALLKELQKLTGADWRVTVELT